MIALSGAGYHDLPLRRSYSLSSRNAISTPMKLVPTPKVLPGVIQRAPAACQNRLALCTSTYLRQSARNAGTRQRHLASRQSSAFAFGLPATRVSPWRRIFTGGKSLNKRVASYKFLQRRAGPATCALFGSASDPRLFTVYRSDYRETGRHLILADPEAAVAPRADTVSHLSFSVIAVAAGSLHCQ